MIRRHGLAVFLFCLSILLGTAVAVLEPVTVFFFSRGIYVLTGIVTVLLITALILWQVLKKPAYTRDPARSLRRQGTAFAAWYAAHNLFWATAAGYTSLGLFKFFGIRSWVIVLSAGALACAVYAVIGAILVRKREMLGLCWQSKVPDGLENFWARAGASLILLKRYEIAAELDQKLPAPLLWSLTRIYNRAASGGADRAIDLLEPRREFLSTQLKKESRHRFKVLLVLFCITAALSALPQLLGIAGQHWDQVPAGWPAAQLKNPQPPKPEKNDESTPKNDNSAGAAKQDKQDIQDKQEQGKPSSPDSKNSKNGKNSEPGQSNQTVGDSTQDPAKQEQENQDNGKQSSTPSQPGKDEASPENKPEDNKREPEPPGTQQDQSAANQKSEDPQNQVRQDKTGKDEKSGQTADKSGRDNSSREQDNQNNANKDKDNQNKDNQNKDNKGDKEKGDQGDKAGGGKDKNEGKPDQGEGQGQEEQSAQNQEKAGTEGAAQKGSGATQGSSQAADIKKEQGGGKGKGEGDGQGLGSPDDTPEMLAEPEPLPQIPSRNTGMVTLELPTLMDKQIKNRDNEKPQDKDTPGKKLSPKGKAPKGSNETGKQEHTEVKPEQYLPNWILNLLKIKEDKSVSHKQ